MIRCGNPIHDKAIVDANGHHHETVAQVRLCYAREFGIKSIEEAEYDAYADWQAQAEYEAELRNEQWFENGGEHAEIIWWENEQDRLREAGLAF